MIKFTRKDKIFAMVFPPVAVVALYGWFAAAPLHREVSGLGDHLASLGGEESLAIRRQVLERKLVTVKEQLRKAEASAVAAPESAAVVSAEENDATRLRRVCDLLISCGVRILSCSVASSTNSQPDSESGYQPENTGRCADVLKQMGVAHPSVWRISIEAPYPALTKMLREIATRKLPVIPETISMNGGVDADKPEFWTITLWL